MARSAVRVRIKEVGKADELLAGLPIELRGNALTKAVRAAGNVVAKEARRLAPKPGYAGDDASKEPLNKTIKVKVRRYNNAIVGFVGPTRPNGAHGHLVEYGHAKVLWGKRTDGFVKAKPFLRPAADTTEAEQQRKIVDTLKAELKKLA